MWARAFFTGIVGTVQRHARGVCGDDVRSFIYCRQSYLGHLTQLLTVLAKSPLTFDSNTDRAGDLVSLLRIFDRVGEVFH